MTAPRRALRGMGLVEALIALAIVGGLLAVLSTVLFQAAVSAERQAIHDSRAETETATRHLLQARLEAIALVAESEGARRPLFEVGDRRLVFVTRFIAPAPLSGLWRIAFEAGPEALTVTLTDWPDAREEERIDLPLGGVRFAPEGMGALVEGLPRAIVMALPGGPVRLRLGAELPLDCVLAVAPPALAAGALACPGQRQ